MTSVNGEEVPVPGLMAIGEAACVSVHGANRLGSNSLIDLVVFGKAAADRINDTVSKTDPNKEIDHSAVDKILDRFDKIRNSNGTTPTSQLRDKMQKVMQNHCAVFRDDEILSEGKKKIEEIWLESSDISVTDLSLIHI